jgi:hypothetical protein
VSTATELPLKDTVSRNIAWLIDAVNAPGFSVQRLIKTVASKKAYESALISQENFRIGVFGTKVAVREFGENRCCRGWSSRRSDIA